MELLLAAAASGIMLLLTVTIPEINSEVYCEAETFEPKCRYGEVIVIGYGLYGRMELNKCIHEAFGYLGCSVDVTPELQRNCSGRTNCQIRIPDTELDKRKNGDGTCPKDLKTYLETNYTCLKVEDHSCEPCYARDGSRNAVLTSESGYIASNMSDKTECGSETCPWIIRMAPGQLVLLTIQIFSNLPHTFPETCYHYGSARERGKQVVRLCATRGDRPMAGVVYNSTTNEIELILRRQMNPNFAFMLHYQALGCPEQEPPAYAKTERAGDKLTIICVASGLSTVLQCKNRKWIGEAIICPPVAVTDDKQGIIVLPLGVLIAIVVGIAFVVGVCILTIGLVLLKRYQRDNNQLQVPVTYNRRQHEYEFQEIPERHCMLVKKESSSESDKYHSSIRENVYAPGIESRPLPPIPQPRENAPRRLSEHRMPSRTGAGVPPPPPVRHMPGHSRGEPSYFVLDPDQIQIEPICERTALTNANTFVYGSHRSPTYTGQMSPMHTGHMLPTRVGQTSPPYPPNISPEEENTQNFNLEVSKHQSCQDVACPVTVAPSTAASGDTSKGNSSWP